MSPYRGNLRLQEHGNPEETSSRICTFRNMFPHHTKSKGDLGVLKAKVDLFEQGFLILNPETEHAPFDLVIYKNGIFKTVQVKYRSLNKNGALEVVFRSTYSDSKGRNVKEVDKDKIDIYAVYCPDVDQCFYFDPKLFNKSIAIRVNTPLNNQKALVNNAADFRKVP